MKKVLKLIFSFTLVVAVVLTTALPGFAYTVRPGDTLDKIAREHNTTVDAIMERNSFIADSHWIFPGQELDIPGGGTSSNKALTAEEIQILYSLFDAEYYAETYEDVVNALGNDPAALFEHFCVYGLYELRQLNKDFNVSAYAVAYDDLSKAFGTDVVKYYRHLYEYGRKENRTITTMEALAATGVNAKLLEKVQCTVTDKDGRPQFKLFYEDDEKDFVIPDDTPSAPSPAPTAGPCKHTEFSFEDAEHHKCVECGELFSHYGWESVSFHKHKCADCSYARAHEYVNGVCTVCKHKCEHYEQLAGEKCEYCGEVVPVSGCINLANHASLHQGKKCPNCEYIGTAQHQWEDGYCSLCELVCPTCGGEGSTDTNGCAQCGKKSVPCSFDHSLRCTGWICDLCHKPGTGTGEDVHWFYMGKCKWCDEPCPEDHSGFCPGVTCWICEGPGTGSHCWAVEDEYLHSCDDCTTPEAHSWENGICTVCDTTCLVCLAEGKPGTGCEICGKVACIINHNEICTESTCPECGAQGKGDHDFDHGKCKTCDEVCPTCGGASNSIPTGEECDDCYLEGTGYRDCDELGHLWDDDRCSYCGTYKCEEGLAPHTWNSTTAECDKCRKTCDWCTGDGKGTGCPVCGKPCAIDHSAHCNLWMCDVCLEFGTGGHSYSPETGKCIDCGTNCYYCSGEGVPGGCPTCGKVSP